MAGVALVTCTVLIILLFLLVLVLLKEKEKRVRLATEMFNEWREKYLSEEKERIRKEVEEKYKVLYEKWRAEAEEAIRRDAVKRSEAVVKGRVAEQLAPIYIFKSLKINPKDLRFIGSPVDYVAFKGLSDGSPSEVVFIEVKTGKSSLSKKERDVKRLVESRKVRWLTIRI